jgi:glycosyltransferase involved in cell wall biosynthesis
MALRVALLTPFGPPSIRGNAVTAARIARGLSRRGVTVQIWDLSVTPEERVAREVGRFRPAVLHALHAYRVGPLALRVARRTGAPLVVTLTGTDVNHDLDDPERGPWVREVLEGAQAVVVFHSSVADRLVAVLPGVEPRLRVIPQAVSLEDRRPFDLSGRWPLPPERVLFVFPGGIRPVKRPRLALEPLGRLATRRPEIRLLYVGPILDPDEGEALRRALTPLPWARHLGSVPHAQMASLLEQADVVLNCSLSEGGMANAVLEALAVGRAVLASDVPGNRSLVEDGITGLLFRDADELAAHAERLAGDPALRKRLGEAGRARVLALYPPEREIDGYLDLYQRLVGAPRA